MSAKSCVPAIGPPALNVRSTVLRFCRNSATFCRIPCPVWKGALWMPCHILHRIRNGEVCRFAFVARFALEIYLQRCRIAESHARHQKLLVADKLGIVRAGVSGEMQNWDANVGSTFFMGISTIVVRCPSCSREQLPIPPPADISQWDSTRAIACLLEVRATLVCRNLSQAHAESSDIGTPLLSQAGGKLI